MLSPAQGRGEHRGLLESDDGLVEKLLGTLETGFGFVHSVDASGQIPKGLGGGRGGFECHQRDLPGGSPVDGGVFWNDAGELARHAEMGFGGFLDAFEHGLAALVAVGAVDHQEGFFVQAVFLENLDQGVGIGDGGRLGVDDDQHVAAGQA